MGSDLAGEAVDCIQQPPTQLLSRQPSGHGDLLPDALVAEFLIPEHGLGQAV